MLPLLISVLAAASQLSAAAATSTGASKVEFVTAEFQGEEYRRLLEPMPQFVPAAPTIASSQVHLTLGGAGANSVTVSWVNSALTSSSVVMYGATAASMTSMATGTGLAYTQLLSPSSGNLVNPSMGAPGATAAQIIALANTSSFAYDHNTGKRWTNYKNVKVYATGQLGYSNPYAYYDSPIIHTTVLTGLVNGMTYYYQPAGASKVYSFTMIPKVTTYPFKAGLVADLGTTDVSAKSVAVLAAMNANIIIFTGDLSYADGWVPTWDVFGVMIEPLAAYVPILSVGGNHELGSTENWQSYSARYPTNPQDSNSPNFCYHGREVGPMNIISLCSYGAANYAGLNTGAQSLQYQWLTTYLTTIDRNRTPWILVQFHVPVYCTNAGHYMEGEIFRRQYEPLLYKYGVDIVMNGHVHAYERSHPVYNNTVDPCGITHLVLGDGGNYENAYVPWITPQQSWSAFREASFGVASLNVMSASQANYTWHRHACGALSPGNPNYNQNFSSSCVSPLDNSANVAQSVDSYILTRPSAATCPNKYISATTMKRNLRAEAPVKVVVEKIDATVVVVETNKIEVSFVEGEKLGEAYRRLLEPMPQFVPAAPTIASSQVHLTLGGAGANSVTVSWVNSALTSSSVVMYGATAASMTSMATGTGLAYTQLLSPSSGNLVNPSMGAPGATAAQIIALANTSSFAYDHNTGKRWTNYKNVKVYATGQLGYSNPYAYYDSPIIHTTVLTGLVNGMTYYYQPAGASKVYSFTMIPKVTTYPFKAGLVADLGTTDVSAKSVAVLAAMNANIIIFTGDLSYADGWVPTWDVFGVMIEPLAAYVPILSVGGNHELGSTENWQSYSARYPTNPQDSNSPNFCYHGREVGPMNIISLCSYGAANYAGLNTGAQSLQYQWLTTYLTTIDRNRTPWILVQFHVPVYCTNAGHYMEGEIFRRQYEPLLYKYGVDIVMNGHVHAYERSHPVYNNTVDPCGITHLVLGDGGNYENAYVPWITPQQSWSAFREASFGVASLNVMSASQANYTWHRHACGALSPGNPNYNQNFSSSCVSPLDNSANVAQSVDSYILTRPSAATCPNKYVSSVMYPATASPSSVPSMAPSMMPSTKPTSAPSMMPSMLPTSAPSMMPSTAPSMKPSMASTSAPSTKPTSAPSMVPSTAPSMKPSMAPTMKPSTKPSVMPTMKPTMMPTQLPSMKPSVMPTMKPSPMPSVTPMPSVMPTPMPTVKVTAMPTAKVVTMKPSASPTTKAVPTMKPSKATSAPTLKM